MDHTTELFERLQYTDHTIRHKVQLALAIYKAVK